MGLAHVHILLFVKSAKKKLDVIFYPMFDVIPSKLVHLQASNACPTVTASPETVKAAFTKETDVFAEQGLKYLAPIVNMADKKLFAQQLFEAFVDILGLSPEENDRAVEVAYEQQHQYEHDLQKKSREILDLSLIHISEPTRPY